MLQAFCPWSGQDGQRTKAISSCRSLGEPEQFVTKTRIAASQFREARNERYLMPTIENSTVKKHATRIAAKARALNKNWDADMNTSLIACVLLEELGLAKLDEKGCISLEDALGPEWRKELQNACSAIRPIVASGAAKNFQQSYLAKTKDSDGNFIMPEVKTITPVSAMEDFI